MDGRGRLTACTWTATTTACCPMTSRWEPTAASRARFRSTAALRTCGWGSTPACPPYRPTAGRAWVTRVDPGDGATGVFRDPRVLACLSHPADAATVRGGHFRVEEAGGGEVPGEVLLSPDGRLLIWTAARPLVPGVEHLVPADGLKDHRGREVAPHRSRFVPCALARDDVPG